MIRCATLTADATARSRRHRRVLGGGLYNGGMATITDCTISDNTATGQGGGIVNGTLETRCVLILTDSTLSGNTSTGGGAGLLTAARRH